MLRNGISFVTFSGKEHQLTDSETLSEKSEMPIIVLKNNNNNKIKSSSEGYTGKHEKMDRITRSLSVMTPYCRDNQFSSDQFISSIKFFNQSSERIYFGSEKNLTK